MMDLTNHGITLLARRQGLWQSWPTSLMSGVQGYTPGESPLCWECLQGIRSKQMYKLTTADCQHTHLVPCERWFSTFNVLRSTIAC